MLIFILSLGAGVMTVYSLLDKSYGADEEEQILNHGKGFVEFYRKATDKERFKATYDRLYEALYMRFQLYDPSGQIHVYGHSKNKIIDISKEAVNKVKQGQTYKGNNNAFGYMVIGLPFTMDDGNYAVFIYFDDQRLEQELYKSLYLGISASLVIGVGLILIVSRYIVQPLTEMTAVTKQLAKGQFNIQLHSTRKDEIGMLSRSIDAMAEDLSKLEEMRRHFISDVSHEIQSPLTSIRGFSKALKSPEISKAERLEYSEIIEQESERLSRLCHNLLSLSSLESEKHPFHPTSYSLDEQIRELIVTMEPQWSEKELELDLTLPQTVIQADRDLLYQVWCNLLQNSIKYNQQGGKIKVWLKQKGETILVGVEDTGLGIAKADQRRIFERFYRADSSRTEKTSNGIGLSIVKKIVDLHKGEIEIYSKIGKGSSFIVHLPSFVDKN
ncbi:sensor histidine kinase [Bacillus xiapuensis]|uniref:sensor histidine kinase n=1 Tax=Bacillus xiapuensis TaxID=2014075 RepID=UPI001E567287|nr:HAMP domain-containing sensor histidine kinase [Bacillus xiapuensis]